MICGSDVLLSDFYFQNEKSLLKAKILKRKTKKIFKKEPFKIVFKERMSFQKDFI